MKITAIIAAAGSGTRYSQDKNKLLEDLSGMPVIIRTLQKLSNIEKINNIIICTSSDIIDEISRLIEKYHISKPVKAILGGKTRQESIFLGLSEAEKENPDFILIHDGARPLISKEIIINSINCAEKNGACIVAVPSKDTIKKVNPSSKQIIETVERSQLWNVQTPQIFKFNDIFNAHKYFLGQDFTDDSVLLEKLNIPITVVMGSYENIKITTLEDIEIARILLTNK